MMDFSAAHAGFVIASYAVSAAVIIVLIAAIQWRTRQAARALAALEAQGAPRRRSAGA